MTSSSTGSLVWLSLFWACAAVMFGCALLRMDRGENGLAFLNLLLAFVFMALAYREHGLLRRDTVSTREFPLREPRRFDRPKAPVDPGKPMPSPPKDIYDL